jgi:hypothetical protein
MTSDKQHYFTDQEQAEINQMLSHLEAYLMQVASFLETV